MAKQLVAGGSLQILDSIIYVEGTLLCTTNQKIIENPLFMATIITFRRTMYPEFYSKITMKDTSSCRINNEPVQYWVTA